MEATGEQMELRDERVVAALFILLQFFLQKQPTLLPEGLWLLNNLTGMLLESAQAWPFIIIKIFIKTNGGGRVVRKQSTDWREKKRKGGLGKAIQML